MLATHAEMSGFESFLLGCLNNVDSMLDVSDLYFDFSDSTGHVEHFEASP